MGKKLLIASVILVAVLFGLIFWKVNQTDPVEYQPVVKDLHQNLSVSSSQNSTQKNITSNETSVDHRQMPKENLSQIESTQTLEQVAPAAFGVLQQQEVLQVVGLLSNHDKNASLMQYINQLCQTKICDVDVSYRGDIMDAKWQDNIVNILKLFGSEKVQDGSLFVQANSIKLEGKVTDVKSEVALQKYLNRLKEEGLKTQNLNALDAVSAVSKVQESNISAQTNVIKPMDVKAEDLKIEKKPMPVKRTAVKKVEKSTPRKHMVRKKKPTRKIGDQDMIAPSYMETSIDLEKKIKAKMNQQQKPLDHLEEKDHDVVAKSRLEILD